MPDRSARGRLFLRLELKEAARSRSATASRSNGYFQQIAEEAGGKLAQASMSHPAGPRS